MKKKQEIFYFSHYLRPKEHDCYDNSNPAACSMIDYVSETIENCGLSLKILSAVIVYGKHFLKFKKVPFLKSSSISYSPVLPQTNRLFRKVSVLLQKMFQFFWLLFNLKRGDVLIVYHSREIINLITVLKKLKKIKLVLQVAEIYSDVDNDVKKKKKEMDFFGIADSYILQTKDLNSLVNTKGCPFVVLNGIYKPLMTRKEKKVNTECINCVYAGTLNPIKGGAYNAVLAANFLPKNYHVHIIGQGSRQAVKNLKNLIDSNANNRSATVSFDGYLSGDKLYDFISSCDIGLSTQYADATFCASSFPSKILLYLCCGIRVISARISVVENSSINELVNYYDTQSPEQIAKAITQVDFTTNFDAHKKIESLNAQFRYEIEKIVASNRKDEST